MAKPDGSVIIDTQLDQSGLRSGLADMAGTVSSGITKAVAAAGTALAALGGYAISVGSEFEAACSNLAATMGTTTDQITDLVAKAEQLGASTAFSASQAAEGLNILAQSGLSASEQLASIDAVLDLAAAGEMEMSNAASYLTTTIKAMGLEMEDAGYLADMYAKGATLANTSTAQLGDAVTSAASMAGGFNQSLETMTTSLLLLAEKGYQGSAAGTYLSRAMADLYAPTSQAKSALDDLGVAIYDASGNQRDFIDIINDMNGAMASLTEEEKAAYTGAIFTTAGLKAFNAISANSAETIDGLTQNLTDCSGAAAQMAETKLDNLQGDMTKLKSATEGFGISLYNNMQAPLRDFAQEGISIMEDLNAAISEGGMEGLADALGGALSKAVTKVVEYVPMLAEAAGELLHSLVNGFVENAPVLAEAAVSIVITLVDTIFTCATDLIVLGGELILSLVDGFINGLPTLITAATTGILSLVTQIVTYLPQLVLAGVELLSALASGIMNALPTLIEAIPEIIDQMVAAFTELFPQIVDTGVALLTSLIEDLPGIIEKIVSVLPHIIESVINALLGQIPLIIQCGIDLLVALVRALPQIIQTIVGALPQIISSIIEALLANIPAIIDAGVELFVALVENLPTIIVEIIKAIPQIIGHILDAIKEYGPDMIQAGKDLLLGLADGIGRAIGSVVEKAKEAAGKVLKSVKGFFGISSPSRVFRDDIGDMLMKGLAEGIAETGQEAVLEAERISRDIREVEFDAPNPDDVIDIQPVIGGAYDKLRKAVETMQTQYGTKPALGIDSRSFWEFSDDTDDEPSPSDRPRFEGDVYLDGKKVGRVMAPHIEKELDWRKQ